ncbi:MAG: hypothetical protein Q8O92_04260 [Candidatus Latescibacter sp.]|nr:hypothetical protein [Candidatus Latescibacter sp.]
MIFPKYECTNNILVDDTTTAELGIRLDAMLAELGVDYREKKKEIV